MPVGPSRHARGLALVELVVAAAVVGVLVGVFALAGADARRAASLGESDPRSCLATSVKGAS